MKDLKAITVKTVLTLALITIFSSALAQSFQKAESNKEMKIYEAVMYGNLDGVKHLISEGADLNVKEQMGGSTPLMSAITFNHPEIGKVLLEAGADVNIQNNQGSTALHTAAFFCRVEMVKMLTDGGADRTVKNVYGVTARESVMSPFAEAKPVYEMVQAQLGSFGLKLDMEQIEKTRPLVANMLK